MGIRYYLFGDDGVHRMSNRLVEGLVFGREALPQYAGTKQRVGEFSVESDDGKPHTIRKAIGTYFEFDDAGKIQESNARAAWELFDLVGRPEPPGKVVSLVPSLELKRYNEKHRWKPSREQIELVAGDIFREPQPGAPQIKQIKGAPKPPPLTTAAEYALRDIREHLWKIQNALSRLTEPGLKGLAFKARRDGEADRDELMLGIARQAERLREVILRRRSGKGTWYAVIETITRGDERGIGESQVLVEEKCGSLREAEDAVKRLLAENAKYFSERTSIEGSVFTDLEWDNGRIESVASL